MIQKNLKVEQIGRSAGNAINLDFRKRLAVATLYFVSFASFLFEDDYFVALLAVEYGCGHLCGVQHRRAYGYVAITLNQEYLIECDFIAFRGF